jgi:hypothetical protein
MTAGTPTKSEIWFDSYLKAHGYTYDVEPDYGVPKHPDRLVTRDGLQAVCEVKQFDSNPLDGIPSEQAVWVNMHKPVRSAVKQAANQLRPLEGRGLPLVVVLANPKGYYVGLDTEDVVHALYGDDTVQIPIYLGSGATSDFPRDDFKFIAGRNGQIRMVGQYISAVVILRHRMRADDIFARRDYEDEIPTGEYWCVDVIRTISDEAVPLPDNFFDGPRDTLWAYDAETEVMAQVK